MNYIKTNLLNLIVLLLLGVLFIQRCDKPGVKVPQNHTDTVYSVEYHYFKDTSSSKPVFVKHERDTILESSVEYIPSDDVGEMKEQFEQLRVELLSRNIFKDQIKVDTFGTIDITDTVQKNQITGRGIIKNLKIPEKTITITNTVYPKAKNQFFIGGGIGGNQFYPVHDVNLGLAFLNKKGQLFEGNGRIDLKGNVYGEINSYWKIKLHK